MPLQMQPHPQASHEKPVPTLQNLPPSEIPPTALDPTRVAAVYAEPLIDGDHPGTVAGFVVLAVVDSVAVPVYQTTVDGAWPDLAGVAVDAWTTRFRSNCDPSRRWSTGAG